MTDYRPAEPSGLDRDTIEAIGTDVSKIYYDPQSEVAEVVSRMGGVLGVRDYMTSEATGSIYIEEDGRFEVYVPKHTSAAEDRFTVAHEIGHLILHHMWPRHMGQAPGRITADRYGEGRAEDEANWFAAAFLMPEDRVRNRFDAVKSVPGLAAEFCVPLSAAAHRLRRLGLIDSSIVEPIDPVSEVEGAR